MILFADAGTGSLQTKAIDRLNRAKQWALPIHVFAEEWREMKEKSRTPTRRPSRETWEGPHAAVPEIRSGNIPALPYSTTGRSTGTVPAALPPAPAAANAAFPSATHRAGNAASETPACRDR